MRYMYVNSPIVAEDTRTSSTASRIVSEPKFMPAVVVDETKCDTLVLLESDIASESEPGITAATPDITAATPDL